MRQCVCGRSTWARGDRCARCREAAVRTCPGCGDRLLKWARRCDQCKATRRRTLKAATQRRARRIIESGPDLPAHEIERRIVANLAALRRGRFVL